MPVDPNGFLDAISSGLEKVPAGLFAAALLAGPTLIWLIARVVNPSEHRQRTHTPRDNLEWVCESCRSVNEDRLDRCYSCRVRRGESIPVDVEPGRAPAPQVGMAVGPGLPAVQQTAESWLRLGGASVGVGAAPVGTNLPGAGLPVAAVATLAERTQGRSWPETAVVAAAPPRIVEPVRLEPKMKVSGRQSTAKADGGGKNARRPKPMVVAAAPAAREPKVIREERPVEPQRPAIPEPNSRDVATERISVELARLLRGGIALVIEAPQTEIYVQFAHVGDQITGEAVGESNLSELSAHRIGPMMRSHLAVLGWVPPADPASNAGNWTRTWRESDWDPIEVAGFVVRTFEAAYGVEPAGLSTYSGAGAASG